MLFVVGFLLVAASVVSTGSVVTDGFVNPTTVLSVGKKASCVTGLLDVAVTATNQKFRYSGPASQLEATGTVQELVQANSTLYQTVLEGPSNISDTYQIWAKLCVPRHRAEGHSVQTIQLLTHGGALDSGFWDFAPGYSYVDAASEAGYSTLSYDRLGTGRSDHPDPIQVVQGSIQVEIVHALVQLLRAGRIGGQAFPSVVGVGHSAGTAITLAVTARYPKDLDAVILTGTSASTTYIPVTFAALSLIIANQDPSGRFARLSNGYLTPSTLEGFQLTFFRYPFFDPMLLRKQFETRQTVTFGELLTLGGIAQPASNFTGPVDVVLPEQDFPSCGADCTSPEDPAAVFLRTFYPAAASGSQHYLVPDAGHNFVAHRSAPQAFEQMIAFLRANQIH